MIKQILFATIIFPGTVWAITNCSLDENLLKHECGGKVTPDYPEPKPAPTFIYGPDIKDAYGVELPALPGATSEQLQSWHDDAASEGINRAYNHYLACWHTRALEQIECRKR